MTETTAVANRHQRGEHASVRTYIVVATVLAGVTALEIGVIYIRFLTPIIVPLLLAMSAAKFALVVLFFMHLRYDSRALSGLFVGPLVIATVIIVALMSLVGGLALFHSGPASLLR